MKKINYVFTMILVFILIAGGTLSAKAADSLPNCEKEEITVNEYEYLKELARESDSELRNYGYSSEELAIIRSLNDAYAEHLKEMALLSDETLIMNGYTSDQVQMLRSFNGTEEEIRALAATVTLSLSINYVTWSESSSRTEAYLRYDFDWAGVPVIKTTDIVACTWNDWSINARYSFVTYYPLSGSGSSYSAMATYVANSGPSAYGGGFRFAMTQSSNAYWAKEGYGVFTLYYNNSRKDLSAYAYYGHTTISATPSFSFPGSGSIGFSYGTTVAAQDWADMECEN